MAKRVTIYDIATELQISTATVNRALTGKARVSEETRQRVFEAANHMGFKPNTLARSLSRRPIRLAVVAFTSFPEFHNQMVQGVKESQRELVDYKVQVDYFNYEEGSSNTPEGLAFLENTLEEIARAEYDGLLICARQVDGFEKLREKKICVATVVNDVDPCYRQFCIQYHGRVAGRVAAELLWRLGERGRPVAIATGSAGSHSIHSDILKGFKEQMVHMPLEIAAIYHHHDDMEAAYTQTKRLLNHCSDFGGIYVDSFNSLGVVRAVEEAGLSGQVCLITSDIYEDMRTFITQGIVSASIYQNQYEQGRRGLKMLYHAIADGVEVPDVVLLPPQVILQSNLSLFSDIEKEDSY